MNEIITRRGFARKKLVITVVVVVAVVVIIALIASAGSRSQYQFATVTQGSITEVVSVTGNTTPIESVDLSFPSGGAIAAVYKNAGDNVNAGDPLVKLDTSGLQAQLAQAQAQVQSAEATLANLQAGSTPQSVQVSQTALASAEQTLANTYTNIPNVVSDAYAKANDAIYNQVEVMYANPNSNDPTLSFSVNDSQLANNATTQWIQVQEGLSAWQTEINAFSTSTTNLSTSTLSQLLNDANNRLSVVTALLNTDAEAIVDAPQLSASTAATYKTNATNAIGEVSTASSDIGTLQQNIASEQAAVAQAQAQLSVTLAGSTPQAIAAQQAAVAQAQANAQSIEVSIANDTLSSPIAGVVTVQNAKVGQVAVAGQTMTSVISGNNFEVDSYVPETDIGKVAVGNPVTMTFDAFSGENFAGTVFYIDPAQTIESGVVDYLVKVSFNTPDPRIKSGLTANLDIDTQTDQNALILPQYAVIQNASGTYVDILQNGKETQVPVTLGIRDQNGNVEIVSGVTDGEKVVNVGLKSP